MRITASPASWAARLGYPQTGGSSSHKPWVRSVAAGVDARPVPGLPWAPWGCDRYLQANHILSEALDVRLHLLPWHHRAPVQATCSRKCGGKLVPPWGLRVKRVPTWGPEWEGSPKGRGMYMCMADTLLYSRNRHNTGKQLYCNKS